MLISHPSSQVYVRATYSVVEALGPTAAAAIRVGGSLPEGTILAETNPTVALALLLPKQPLESLPSRKRARLVDGRSVRAKTDWYWRIGAGQSIAEALGCSAVASELDHERVAALTCLALAKQLVGASVDGSRAIALGDENGIYLASAQHDRSWSEDLLPVGLRSGAPAPGSRSAIATREFRQMEIATPAEYDGLDADSDRGDDVDLLLCDAGGAWVQHNPWLADLDKPLTVEVIDQPSLVLRLEPAAQHSRSGQWKVSPTAESLAKQLGHPLPLATSTAFSIRGRIGRAE